MKHTVESCLEELGCQLRPLGAEKVQEIVGEYRSHIESGVEAGSPDSELLTRFGSPGKVAHTLLQTHGILAKHERKQLWALAAYGLALATLSLLAYFRREFGANNLMMTTAQFDWHIIIFFIAPAPYYWFVAKSRKLLLKPLAIGVVGLHLFFAGVASQVLNDELNETRSLVPIATSEKDRLLLAGLGNKMGEIGRLALKSESPKLFAAQLESLDLKDATERRLLNSSYYTATSGYWVPEFVKTSNLPGWTVRDVGMLFWSRQPNPVKAHHAWIVAEVPIASFARLATLSKAEIVEVDRMASPLRLLLNTYIREYTVGFTLPLLVFGLLASWLPRLTWHSSRRGIA